MAMTTQKRRYNLLIGLVTGTFAGAILARWYALRLHPEHRHRLTDSAKTTGDRASEHYQLAGARMRDMVDDLANKSRSVRDDVVDAVVDGA